MNIVKDKIGVSLVRSARGDIEEDVEGLLRLVKRLPGEEFETDF